MKRRSWSLILFFAVALPNITKHLALAKATYHSHMGGDPDIPLGVKPLAVPVPLVIPQIIDLSHAAALGAMNSSGTLIFQVTIPKCGTTALKFILRHAWLKLFRSANTTMVKALPFLAGDCEAPKSDAMENCVANRNFPCLATPANNENGHHECLFRPPSNHLGFSETRGFLAERGINLESIPRQRLVYLTVLRDPMARVASEFFHWKRNWCCGWFFSGALSRRKENMTLLEFVEHSDCPANNRQAWMLADLPMFERNQHPNSFYSPSEFRDYFKRRYAGASDYVARLNRDESILTSAGTFLDSADVVGLTERMEATLALTLFAFPAGRDTFFRFRRRPSRLLNEGSSLNAANISAGVGEIRSEDRGLTEAKNDRLKSTLMEGCWELKEDSGFSVRHDRQADYIVHPNEHKATRARNSLDLILYSKAVEIHHRLLQKYHLCAAE